MTDITVKLESGSGGFGVALEDFKRKLQAFEKNISGQLLRESMHVAANIFRDAIEAATPVGKEGYRYREGAHGKTVRSKHRPGQAKDAVIVYERKSRSRLSTTADQLGLLIGYEKRRAYYMYWYEYGRKAQPARAFMRKTCDAAEPAAWRAVQKLLASATNQAG